MIERVKAGLKPVVHSVLAMAYLPDYFSCVVIVYGTVSTMRNSVSRFMGKSGVVNRDSD